MKRILPFLVGISLIISSSPLRAKEVNVTREGDLTVLFESSLSAASKEVVDFYKALKKDLEDTFGWDLHLEPTVLLVKEGARFQMMTKNPLIVAFAVPRKNLIVVDYSKMNVHPFSLKVTLKHELCHLLLHDHLGEHDLSKWLEEGVCQWVSSGIGEIIMDQRRSRLNRATLRHTFIRLSALDDSFPSDEESMLLAYEESKSVVNYMIRHYGKEGVLGVLGEMKKGEAVGVAVLRALSISLEKLEKEWHDSLRRKMTWFTYLSYHLYDILFSLMALLSIYVFIKVMIKKRAYSKDETEEGHLS